MKCENKLSFEPYNRGLIQSCMTGSYPVGIRRRTGMQPDPSIAIRGAYNDVGATIFPKCQKYSFETIKQQHF